MGHGRLADDLGGLPDWRLHYRTTPFGPVVPDLAVLRDVEACVLLLAADAQPDDPVRHLEDAERHHERVDDGHADGDGLLPELRDAAISPRRVDGHAGEHPGEQGP